MDLISGITFCSIAKIVWHPGFYPNVIYVATGFEYPQDSTCQTIIPVLLGYATRPSGSRQTGKVLLHLQVVFFPSLPAIPNCALS